MSPRNKLILLGALVVLLGTLAYLQLGRSKEPARKAQAATTAPARDSPATTSAPAPGGAEAKPADSAHDPGPSAADLRDLANWFDLLRPTGTVIARGGAPVFGMAIKVALPAPRPAPQEPAQTPW